MSDSDERQTNRRCPGCAGHSKTDELLAFGMVISAAEAMLAGRLEDIAYAAKNMTSFEAHKAVTLYVSLLEVFCHAARITPERYLHELRQGINAMLAEV